MQINCIACGHRFELGKSYDDYEGLVRCTTCRFLLDVRTVDGQVRMVRPGSLTPAAPAATTTSVTTATPRGEVASAGVIGTVGGEGTGRQAA